MTCRPVGFGVSIELLILSETIFSLEILNKCEVFLNVSVFVVFIPPFHSIPFHSLHLQQREKSRLQRLLAPVPYLHSRWCLSEEKMYFSGGHDIFNFELLSEGHREQTQTQTLTSSVTVESRHATFRTYPQRSPWPEPEQNLAGWII